jgi:YebC/PmpR family DNA-binding regulatory protein
MSGHSHAKTVAHKKGVADAQRSKIFSKMAGEIAIAAKAGADPAGNVRLRMAIERARSFNMPTANIERAVKRGTGEEKGAALQEVLFEGYGPGNIALLVEGITDNKNRILGEIKQAFEKNQGKLAGEGAVRWMFQHRGVITLPQGEKTKEELELLAIELGAQDTYWREDGMLEIYTNPNQADLVKKELERQGTLVESSSLQWIPKQRVALSKKDREGAEKLFLALDESEEVQEIYANIKD